MRNFCGQCGRPIREDDCFCSDECEEAALTLEEVPSTVEDKPRPYSLADFLPSCPGGSVPHHEGSASPSRAGDAKPSRSISLPAKHAGVPRPGSAVVPARVVSPGSRAGDHGITEECSNCDRRGHYVGWLHTTCPTCGGHGITERDAA